MIRISIFFISFLVFLACEEEVFAPEEYPRLNTLEPIDKDRTGATFRAEVSKEVSLPTESYGFLWDNKQFLFNPSNKIAVGQDLNTDYFEIRIDSALIKGLDYYVRAYTKVGDTYVYGNEVLMKSEGSEKSAWSLIQDNLVLGGEGFISAQGLGQRGGLLFSGSSENRTARFYYYDPVENSFERGENFPERYFISSGYPHLSTSVGEVQYTIATSNKNLYKLEGGNWSLESRVPVEIDPYFESLLFGCGDMLYLLSNRASYKYSLSTKRWTRLSSISLATTLTAIHGFSLNCKGYLISSFGKLWEFNPSDESLNQISDFPGRTDGKLISFTKDQKIFIGFSHDILASNSWLENKFWSYDVNLDQWKPQRSLPISLGKNFLFHFSLADKMYLGHGRAREFDLWEFDPSVDN